MVAVESDDVAWPPPDQSKSGWYRSHVSGRMRYFDGEEWLFWTTEQDLKHYSSDWELHTRYMHAVEDAALEGRLIPERFQIEYERLTAICEADRKLGWIAGYSTPRPTRQQRLALMSAELEAENRAHDARMQELLARKYEEEREAIRSEDARIAAEEGQQQQQQADAQRSSRRGWIIAAVVVGVLVAIFIGRQSGAGATARCQDGSLSYSQHHSGTCSYHGGVQQWLTDSSGDTPADVEQQYLDDQNANGTFQH